MKKQEKQQLVLVGAKVPASVKKLIEEKAEIEERTLSQVISRLLVSHPALQNQKIEKQAA